MWGREAEGFGIGRPRFSPWFLEREELSMPELKKSFCLFSVPALQFVQILLDALDLLFLVFQGLWNKLFSF